MRSLQREKEKKVGCRRLALGRGVLQADKKGMDRQLGPYLRFKIDRCMSRTFLTQSLAVVSYFLRSWR